MNVWAIVPVKPLNRAKSRLSSVLAPELREQLAGLMLRRTITALTCCDAIGGILVISRDNRALVIAREYGAKTVQESGAPELNTALERACRFIASWNAQAALIVPADLPLVEGVDLHEVVELGRYQQSLVIVPDRHEEGTNCLLLRPPQLFNFSFGIGSFQKHLAAAEAIDATVHIFRSERMMLDLDTPDDLRVYLERCQQLGIEPLAGLTLADLETPLPCSTGESPNE